MVPKINVAKPFFDGFGPMASSALPADRAGALNQTTLVYKARGSRGVDEKSTIVNYRLSLLFSYIFLDHLICYGSRTYG
jgi:hypothetical protein